MEPSRPRLVKTLEPSRPRLVKTLEPSRPRPVCEPEPTREESAWATVGFNPKPRIQNPKCAAHAALVLLLAAQTACTITVTPPANLRDPVPVFLADYGYHASLVLPRSDSEVVEYAYGEWNWFVENKNEWYRVFGVMLLPTPGALGRRELAVPPVQDEIRRAVPLQALYKIDVERRVAARLLARLDERYADAGEVPTHNSAVDLHFVHDRRCFCLFQTCNTTLVDWLRELDCRVGGIPASAEYEVREPGDW